MSPSEKLYLVHNRDTLGRILYGLLDAIVIRADRPLPPLAYARHSLAMNSVSNSTSIHYQSSLASPLSQKKAGLACRLRGRTIGSRLNCKRHLHWNLQYCDAQSILPFEGSATVLASHFLILDLSVLALRLLYKIVLFLADSLMPLLMVSNTASVERD